MGKQITFGGGVSCKVVFRVANHKLPEKNAQMKVLAAVAALVAFSTPALADFFIVRDGPSGPCRVVETRPTDTKIVVVGNKAYKVRAEAEKEVAVVCK